MHDAQAPMQAASPYAPPMTPHLEVTEPHVGELVYAGFWARFAALVLDRVILTFVTFILTFVSGLLIAVIGVKSGALAGVVAFGIWGVIFVLNALYFIMQESGAHRASLGKRALGLEVLQSSGEAISFLRATGRYFAHVISSILLLIGYLMQPFTARKQALHDLMTDTVVVVKPREIVTASGERKWVSAPSENRGGVIAVIMVVAVFMFIVVLGILAAVAIPAYSDYTTRAKTVEAVAEIRSASSAIQAYYLGHKVLPTSLEQADFTHVSTKNMGEMTYNPDTAELSVEVFLKQGEPGHVLYTANIDDDAKTIAWACHSEDIQAKHLPQACRRESREDSNP